MKNFIEKIDWLAILREVYGLSGLALIGYGLFLFRPWVSFTVVGSLLFVSAMAASIMGRR